MLRFPSVIAAGILRLWNPRSCGNLEVLEVAGLVPKKDLTKWDVFIVGVKIVSEDKKDLPVFRSLIELTFRVKRFFEYGIRA